LANLYNTLGVSPSATADDIKKAYRSLAMRYHPDRNAHSGSESRFNAIKTAHEVLSDPKKRAEYNQSLNNRIIIDPDSEARALWHSLFDRCGVVLPRDSH
jgi:molecular chaperone DnaJ